MNYLNFDLLIERAPEGYIARVHSPAGEATARFRLPFTEMELENYLLKIGRPRRGCAPVEFSGNGIRENFWQAPV